MFLLNVLITHCLAKDIQYNRVNALQTSDLLMTQNIPCKFRKRAVLRLQVRSMMIVSILSIV